MVLPGGAEAFQQPQINVVQAQPRQTISGVVQAQPTQTISGVVQAQPKQTISGVTDIFGKKIDPFAGQKISSPTKFSPTPSDIGESTTASLLPQTFQEFYVSPSELAWKDKTRSDLIGDLIKSPIKELLVTPGVRFVQAVASIYPEYADDINRPQTIKFPLIGDITVEGQRAGLSGVKQVVGQGLAAASWLYMPEKVVGIGRNILNDVAIQSIKDGVRITDVLVRDAFWNVVKKSAAQGALIGSFASLGNSFQQEDKKWTDNAKDFVIGGLFGAGLGGGLGAGGSGLMIAKNKVGFVQQQLVKELIERGMTPQGAQRMVSQGGYIGDLLGATSGSTGKIPIPGSKLTPSQQEIGKLDTAYKGKMPQAGDYVKERGFMTSLKEHPETEAIFKDLVENYGVHTNKGDIAKIRAMQIMEPEKILALANSSEKTAEVTIARMVILKDAIKAGNVATIKEMGLKMAREATPGGQFIQAYRTLGVDLGDPAKAIVWAHQGIENFNKKIAPNFEGKITNIERTFKKIHEDVVETVIKQTPELQPKVPKLTTLEQKVASREVPPAEELAHRITPYFKAKKPNPVKDMINTLYKLAQEQLPAKGKTPPRNAIDLIGQALRDKEIYKTTWLQAQDIVRKRWADKPEALALLDKYFNKTLLSGETTHAALPVAEKQIGTAVKQGLKAENINLREIVSDNFANLQGEALLKTKVNVIDRLVKQANVPAHEANLLKQELGKKIDLEIMAKREALIQTAQRQLAAKIQVLEKTKKTNPLTDMVNALAKKAEEVLPKKSNLVPRNKIELVGQILRDKSLAVELWEPAQKLVMEKYKNNPEALKLLNEYFDKTLMSGKTSHGELLVSDKMIFGALGQQMKVDNINLSKIVREHYTVADQTGKDLATKLVEQANAPIKEAYALSAKIQTQFENLVKARKDSALKAIFSERKITGTKSFVDRIIEMSNLGAFDKVEFRDKLAEKLGLMSMSDDLAAKIIKQSEFIQQMPKDDKYQVFKQGQNLIKIISDATPITKGEILGNVLNMPRALMASFDLSFGLRQGLTVAYRHPIIFGRAFKAQFGMLSEKGFEHAMDLVMKNPDFERLVKNGLDITDLISRKEEAFMSSWAEKIPFIGKGVKMSARAYAGMANKLRVDVAVSLLNDAERIGLNPRQNDYIIKEITNLVNLTTGRGSLGKHEAAAPLLNAIFFSPRLMMSRLQLMNPVYYYKLDPFVRKEALKSMFAYTASTMTILGLAKASGLEVGVNPLSADFGKIKVGNTRIDIMGGFQQYIRMTSQLVMGKYISSTTGKEYKLEEGYKPLTRFDILQRQFEFKTSPLTSFVIDLAKGQDYVGEPTRTPKGIGKALLQRVTPMVGQDIYDLYKEDPYLLPLGFLNTFGFGVQTYGPRKPTPKPFKVPVNSGNRPKIKF